LLLCRFCRDAVTDERVSAPSPICHGYIATTGSFSKINAVARMFGVILDARLATDTRTTMAEKAFGFSASAIDELNRHPSTRHLSTKQFALLLVGLAAVLLLLYAQIVW
jgi:hypothetical protein